VLGFQKQYLKALAHSHKAVVQIGKDGLTDSAVAEVRAALLAHELIKVRLMRPPDKQALARELGERADAALCELIGHTVILYRPHPKEPHIVLPTRAGS